ncbi:unnamed protein product [Caenorhabditis bovis]|uniref:Cyanocobalamin reductase (cyanide-eliminating) n=1 Tax=Caenorhabditis bovis TaxID=2654633 RepID=A0A8S1F1P3_9PELO|nr:unnamed protein product [Caenorhabditis bovis]
MNHTDSLRHAFDIKKAVDAELSIHDGFESHIFKIGSYNQEVSHVFRLPYDGDAMALLILSTPNMFDVAFRKWIVEKTMEYGSFEALAENCSSPIQEFLNDRLQRCLDKISPIENDIVVMHDYSMTPQRRPLILMQTCGHVAGAAFYYQPRRFSKGQQWPPTTELDSDRKFIGLSLHPIYGGHFAFRTVLIFPNVHIPEYKEPETLRILTNIDEIRVALEKFNYNYKDSGFRDFGTPKYRYSETQVEYFGRPVADRWEVLRPWVEGAREIEEIQKNNR